MQDSKGLNLAQPWMFHKYVVALIRDIRRCTGRQKERETIYIYIFRSPFGSPAKQQQLSGPWPGVRHVDTAAEYGTEEAVARGVESRMEGLKAGWRVCDVFKRIPEAG